MYDWSKITVATLQRLIDVYEKGCDGEDEVLDRDIKLISIITGIPAEEIDNWHKDKFKEHRVKLYDLFSSTRKIAQVNKFSINGITFYFRGSKNLNDLKEHAKAEGITVETLSKQSQHVLAAYYQVGRINSIPQYKKYQSAAARAELFSQAPASAVFSLSNLIASATPIIGKLVMKKTESLYNEFGQQVKGLSIEHRNESV